MKAKGSQLFSVFLLLAGCSTQSTSRVPAQVIDSLPFMDPFVSAQRNFAEYLKRDPIKGTLVGDANFVLIGTQQAYSGGRRLPNNLVASQIYKETGSGAIRARIAWVECCASSTVKPLMIEPQSTLQFEKKISNFEDLKAHLSKHKVVAAKKIELEKFLGEESSPASINQLIFSVLPLSEKDDVDYLLVIQGLDSKGQYLGSLGYFRVKRGNEGLHVTTVQFVPEGVW